MLEYICFQIATESQNSHSSLNSLSLQSCHTQLNFKKKSSLHPEIEQVPERVLENFRNKKK